MENQLTAPERTDLRKLCKIVEDGLGKFIEVGSALLEINERKLYRETHKTFEAFASEKFGISKSHAYRMIEAAEIRADLSPIWGQSPIAAAINTEGQLRELGRVGSEALPDIVEKIAEKCEAEGCKPTAKVIKSVVDETLGKTKPEPKPVKPEPEQDSVVREERHLRLARQHLNGLRLALSNLGAGRKFDEYWSTVEDWLDG